MRMGPRTYSTSGGETAGALPRPLPLRRLGAGWAATSLTNTGDVNADFGGITPFRLRRRLRFFLTGASSSTLSLIHI